MGYAESYVDIAGDFRFKTTDQKPFLFETFHILLIALKSTDSDFLIGLKKGFLGMLIFRSPMPDLKE